MIKNYLLFFVLFGLNTVCQAQVNPSKELKGKVISTSDDLENIYVFNLATKKSTLTEKDGFFAINASVGDSLQFSSIQYKVLKVEIKEKYFQNELYYVRLEPLINQLDEVVIKDNKNINAVSLGILSKPAISYTPAERKLYTATDGGAPLDVLINAISGRTKMLKKEVVIEKKEVSLEKIEYYLDDKYFIEALKIPADYVSGFKYYVVEDKKIQETLKGKNKSMLKFLLGELATKYLDIIKEK
jgi:hypothetical protein